MTDFIYIMQFLWKYAQLLNLFPKNMAIMYKCKQGYYNFQNVSY